MERVVTGVAGLMVLGLLAWALVPGSSPGTTVAASAGSPGGAVAGGTRPSAGTSSPGAVASGAGGSQGTASSAATDLNGGGNGTGGSGSPSGTPAAAGPAVPATRGGATPGAGGSSCGQLSATDQGVTASQIHIGVVLVNFQGQLGNSLFGFPTPSDQQAYFQAVIDSINRTGGIQCRKLVATYYQGNPLDTNEEHATCLQMAQDGLFGAVSLGFYQPPSQDCPSANKIPTVLSVPLPPPELNQYYPYLFTVNANWQNLILNYALAANQMGWFKGASKIGLLEVDCQPELNDYMVADLARIGIPKSRLVTYDFGCFVGMAPPDQVEQAVLQFKTSGVTHVVDVNTITLNYFTRQAQQQDYHPKYSFPDGASILAYDSTGLAPDPANFDGALAITSAQFGALQTPGVSVSPATRTCDQIMAAAGLASAEKSGDAASGIACDGMWTLTGAMAHDAGLTRAGMAAGLDQVGQLGFSYPQGPANFTGSKVMTGGEFWRPAVFAASCACFRVTNPNFQPSFS